MLKLNLFEEFFLQIKKRIIYGKEVTINITIKKTLKRKIIDTFLEEILFYANEKCLIVHSSNIYPCQFIVAVLKGKGLKVTSARKLFFGTSLSLRCNECIWRKNKVSFSRYVGFCVFVNSTNFEICDVTRDIMPYEKLHFWVFLLNPRQYQIEIWSNINAAYDGYF